MFRVRHVQAKFELGRACLNFDTVRRMLDSGTTKPKSGLAVPPGCFRMRKFFQEFYAIGTLHNLSVGEELGLGLNFIELLLIVFLLHSFSFYDLSLVFDFNKSFRKKIRS